MSSEWTSKCHPDKGLLMDGKRLRGGSNLRELLSYAEKKDGTWKGQRKEWNGETDDGAVKWSVG